jgi:polysaccharide pyruvyl transferase WcaK-like protein
MAVRPSLKVVILGASFETDNMGVGALAAGTVTSILQSDSRAQIWLMDYAKKPSEHTVRACGRDVRIPLANIRFSKRLYLRNNIAVLLAVALFANCIPSKVLRRRVIRKNVWLKILADADVIGSLAGGDSFSDIYGLIRLIYVSLPQVLALMLNKNVVLLPQTIGPFKSWIGKRLARFILSRAAGIYSRDFMGISVCRKILGLKDDEAKNIHFCYDMGFVLEPVRSSELRFDEPHEGDNKPEVGLNVSGLLLMGGYTKKNMFGLSVSYYELIVRIIDHFIREEGAQVLLVPHVFGAASDSESDSVACEKIYHALKDRYGPTLRLLRGHYNQNEIKAVIGRCDFFIGTRMHACIAALSQNVPAVAIAYSDKFIGVMQTLGTEALVADPRSMGSDEILDCLIRSFQNRHCFRKHLQTIMPDVRRTVLDLFHPYASAVVRTGLINS